MKDLIDRQAAIQVYCKYCVWDCEKNGDMPHGCRALNDLKAIPSAQPERLTDDDFETIRIHLNAYKEKLCNQQRWEEAEEYQRIIDRFIAFASAQPEIVRCKDCRWWDKYGDYDNGYCMAAKHGYWSEHGEISIRRKYKGDFYCADAEGRTDDC